MMNSRALEIHLETSHQKKTAANIYGSKIILESGDYEMHFFISTTAVSAVRRRPTTVTMVLQKVVGEAADRNPIFAS